MSRRRISLPGRRHFDGIDTSATVLCLIEITHASLAAPLLLSTDMTERLSTDPLLYGSRSSWRAADAAPRDWLFAPMEIELPGEIEDAMPEVRMTLSLAGTTVLAALRSIASPAVCNIALMMSDRLDADPEEEHLGLELQTADADLSASGSVEIVLSHPAIDIEMFPGDLMSQKNFPGLYR